MKNIIKTKKGFTLVELVIVIVIVGILSVISVPIYRGYVEKAIKAEGQVLLGAIARAELAYHVQHGCFAPSYYGSYDSNIDIDARGNKYFYMFETCPSNGGMDLASAVPGKSIKKTTVAIDDDYYDNDCVEIWVNGYNNNRAWTIYTRQWASGYMEECQTWDYAPGVPGSGGDVC